MQRIVINQLGPLTHCELSVNDFIICTGPQASGKSTLAKSIFFFKNLRNILQKQFRKRIILAGNVESKTGMGSFQNEFFKEIRLNFLQIFGSSWCMNPEMYLKYYYDEESVWYGLLVRNQEKGRLIIYGLNAAMILRNCLKN